MIKKLFLIMMAVLMVASLSVGCTNDNNAISKAQVDENNSSVVGEDEKEIDKIVACEGWDINTGFVTCYDENEGWGSFFYVSNFYETLVNYDNGEIVPGLALSWEINSNEITFKLREGVKFTDGSEFNAEVVKKNFEMTPKIIGEAFGNSFLVYKLLDNVEVIDEYTVKIVLKEPYYAALQELTMTRPMGMMSLSVFTEDGMSDEAYSKTFGTGKYMIKNAIKGEDYTFIRNENYWGEKPEVKEFIIKTIPDLDSRIMALRTGEVDMIMGTDKLSYDAFSEFMNDDKFLAKISENNIYSRHLILNTTTEIFKDKNVRLAVQHAIDKQSICDSLFYGIEEKADSLFNSKLPYCNVVLNTYKYDIEKTKYLLDEAGWKEVKGSKIREKDGQKLETEILYEAGAGIQEDLVLAISEQLKEAGFGVSLTGFDIMTAWSKAMGGEFIMFVGRTYGVPYEPCTDINIMNKISCHNPAQQGLEEKEEIDLKINELSTMVDKEKIQETYNYLLTSLHDEAMYLPISHRKELVVLNKEKIKDYEFSGIPSSIDISGIKVK